MIEEQLFGQKNVYTDGKGRIYDAGKESLNAREAVRKRFVMEQAARTKEVLEELCMLKNVKRLPDDCYSILGAADFIDGGHNKRTQNVKWHISYFSEEDKNQIEKVMKKVDFTDYELYKGIDRCIAAFRK